MALPLYIYTPFPSLSSFSLFSQPPSQLTLKLYSTNKKMNFNGVGNFHHRRSPSSDHFLDLFSPTKPSAVATDLSDDFTESDVFWTGVDLSESVMFREPSSLARRKISLRPPDKSGILAALPETTTTPFLAIPRPQQSRVDGEMTQSAPSRRMGKSAPVAIPAAMRKPRKFSNFDAVMSDEDEDGEMLPPHEIVALKLKAAAASSVLEGVGRTLKGRDLRQVRNAVWRQTGFCD